MSSSNLLRITHTDFGGGHFIQTPQAISQEKKLQRLVPRILANLRLLYPRTKYRHIKGFRHENKLTKAEINASLNASDPSFGTYQSCAKSCIKPDGGLFLVDIEYNSKCYSKVILASESKRQGTNDTRIAEGKKKQSCGNAIERAVKNYLELANYMIGDGHFPYLVFASGCDFMEQSSIRDRATSMTMGGEPNVINVRKTRIPHLCYTASRASLFMREDEWTSEEVFDLSIQVCQASMNVLLEINELY